jgi:FAD/FMN-containing dehydrogenase
VGSPRGSPPARSEAADDFGHLVQVHEDTAVVQAGARWSEVLRAAIPRGVAPPVLTDYLELSVGGTLSVGGIGGTILHGAQVDNVLELEVVTGTGARVVCSPSRRADLFHAVLAGLGQCGIITRATVRLLPAPPVVRHYELFYPTVAALTADQRRVVRDGRFAFVQGHRRQRRDPAVSAQPRTTPHTVAPRSRPGPGLPVRTPQDILTRGRAHYGPLWPVFTAAKKHYDPSGILTPGQGIFP